MTTIKSLALEIRATASAMRRPKNRAALLEAAKDALGAPGAATGLSARRRVECVGGDANISWDVALGVCHEMIVIDSEIDYRRHTSEQIADVIANCWDPAWDD